MNFLTKAKRIRIGTIYTIIRKNVWHYIHAIQIRLQFGAYPNIFFSNFRLAGDLVRKTNSLYIKYLDFFPPLCFPKFNL